MIGKFLDICTSHLTQDTVDDLDKGFYTYVPVYSYEEGMFIVVPDEFEDKDKPHPDDLGILFKFARDKGITLIRLDRDGEEIDELPTYDWRSSKDKFLALDPLIQQNALMETAMRIQDTADFLRFTGDITIDEDEMRLLQIFTEMAREFEYKYFGTDRYSIDFLKLTDDVFRKELLERFGKEK